MSQFATTGRVVVGTDGSNQASVAVDWAASWAHAHQAGLTVVGIQPDLMIYADGVAYASLIDPAFAAAKETAQRHVRAAMKAAVEAYPGLDVIGQTVEGDAAGILVTASRDAQLVVIGTRGLGAVKGVLLGGVADNVVTNAKGNLAVIPESADPDLSGPIVVGTDSSTQAGAALRFAVAEAHRSGAPLVAVQVIERALLMDYMHDEDHDTARTKLESELKKNLTRSLEARTDSLTDLDLTVHVVVGKPAEELAKATEGARLAIVGSRGRGGFAGLLLGSTSRRLVRSAHCPVLVVRSDSTVETID